MDSILDKSRHEGSSDEQYEYSADSLEFYFAADLHVSSPSTTACHTILAPRTLP